MRSVADLSRAFALAIQDEAALAIRDDVGLFQAVRSVLAKGTSSDRRTDEALDHAIREIVARAVASDEVIDICAAAGLKRSDASILSDDSSPRSAECLSRTSPWSCCGIRRPRDRRRRGRRRRHRVGRPARPGQPGPRDAGSGRSGRERAADGGPARDEGGRGRRVISG
jgi:Domain of unknown function (DUF3387)